MVTLRDIAEKAGVSRMTVSLALRGDPRVAEKTREKVRSVAKKLGYIPNPNVSTLMSEVAKTHYKESGERLAFFTSHTTAMGWKQSDHIRKYYEGASVRAMEYGYVLEPIWTLDPSLSPAKLMRVLWARGIKGGLVAPLGPEARSQNGRTLEVDWSRFAVVELDETLAAPKLTCVRHGHYNGMLLLLHELENLGYRRIGLTMSRQTDLSTRHRWYSAYMFWRKIRELDDSLPVLFYEQPEARELKQWIRANDIDAVAAVDEIIHDALIAEGISIPGDVGFCLLDRPEKKTCRISGISQNSRLVGESSVDILVGLVRRGQVGIPEHPSQWLCSGTWVVGETTCRIGDVLDEQPLFDRTVAT